MREYIIVDKLEDSETNGLPNEEYYGKAVYSKDTRTLNIYTKKGKYKSTLYSNFSEGEDKFDPIELVNEYKAYQVIKELADTYEVSHDEVCNTLDKERLEFSNKINDLQKQIEQVKKSKSSLGELKSQGFSIDDIIRLNKEGLL